MRAVTLLLGAAGAVLFVLYIGWLTVELWRASRRIPDLPLNMRINPFNVLASRRRWTSDIEWLNDKFVSAVLVFGALAILWMIAAAVALPQ